MPLLALASWQKTNPCLNTRHEDLSSFTSSEKAGNKKQCLSDLVSTFGQFVCPLNAFIVIRKKEKEPALLWEEISVLPVAENIESLSFTAPKIVSTSPTMRAINGKKHLTLFHRIDFSWPIPFRTDTGKTGRPS